MTVTTYPLLFTLIITPECDGFKLRGRHQEICYYCLIPSEVLSRHPGIAEVQNPS